MEYQDFKIGMRVQIWDQGEHRTVKGYVIELLPDAENVLIKWEDFKEPISSDVDEMLRMSEVIN